MPPERQSAGGGAARDGTGNSAFQAAEPAARKSTKATGAKKPTVPALQGHDGKEPTNAASEARFIGSI